MRARILIFGIIFAVLFFASLSYSEVPQKINYQGKLTTPAGALIDSTLSMVFSIYYNEPDVSPVWAETLVVQVEKGIFSVVLGNVHPIPPNLFDGTVNYLGVKAGDDPEMTPRKSIVSVAYAYKSEHADTAQYAHAAPAMADADWVIDGDDIYHVPGNVGIGTTSPGYKLHVNGGFYSNTVNTGQGNNQLYAMNQNVRTTDNPTFSRVHLSDYGTALGGFHVGGTSDPGTDNVIVDGNVGIGTTSPGANLDVYEPISPSSLFQMAKFLISGGSVGGGAYISIGAQLNGYNADIGVINTQSTADILFKSFKYGVGKSEVMRITGNGTVGIGTTNPVQKLDVAGTAQVTGFKMPTGASNGYVLTSDGSGVGTWQSASGGIGGSGTTNYIPIFTGSTTLGNSAIYQTGSRVGIGTTSPNLSAKLHVDHDYWYSGYFTSNSLSDFTHVIHSEFTGSGNEDPIAVYGECTPADNRGCGGCFVAGRWGVYAEVSPAGSGGNYYGVMSSVIGGPGAKYGVDAFAGGSGTNFGLYAGAYGGTTNWAGYFSGNVGITGTLSKGAGSFQIDHPLDPENKYLFHSFVESPDMMNVYNGNVILDATGQATVELPAYFEVLNRDFRYQLTAIGAPGPDLYISQEISGNSFKIAGGESGMKVSWQVTGIRQDKFAEANRIQVEVDKPEDERGKYLHPAAYGLGEKYDIHYEKRKQMEERRQRMKEDREQAKLK